MTDITERAETLLAGVDLGGSDSLSAAVYREEGTLIHAGPNTRFADAAPDLVRELLAEVARLRSGAQEAKGIIVSAVIGAQWAGDHTYGAERAIEIFDALGIHNIDE